MNEVFSNMIRRVKNARSHLRVLDIRRAVGSEAFSGAAIFPNCKPPAIMDGYRIGRKLGHAVCAGASTSQQIRPAPIWDGFQAEGGEIAAGMFAGAAGVAGPYRAFIWESFAEPDERSAAVYKRTAAKAGAAMENSGCLCGNRK